MTMSEAIAEGQSFIIVGVTAQGQKFRPGDWADRLSGALSAFGAVKKMRYSPHASPGDYNGDKAVFVDGALFEISPAAYRFLRGFAEENDLQIISGVCSLP
jgi:hypothetical protein